MTNSLMTVTYADGSSGIFLTAYADTVVYDTVNGKKMLCAIRFGGYPEQVDGMTQAVHGGGSIEVNAGGEKLVLHPLLKKYQRKISHDGVYAEAVLIAGDDTRQTDQKNKEDSKNKEDLKNEQSEDDFEESQPTIDLPPRDSYIYTAPGDGNALYEAIDRQTGVPMIPEFADYILAELKRERILTQLTILSNSPKFDAWVLRCSSGDENIVKIVEKGVTTGAISIPGAASVNNADSFSGINSVTGYLNAYGSYVAERIKKLFVPLFDPEKDHLSPEILEINQTIREHAGYSLYDAQLAVAEAIKRRLKHSKVGLIVAECGAGKTKIGAAAIASVVAGLTAEQSQRKKTKTFNIVLCPSHIKKKWVREIEETLPNTFAAIVNTITELNTLYAAYEKSTKNCYAIISKEMARDGYMHMPGVTWSRIKKGFICPQCGNVIQMYVSRDGARYVVDADQFFFKKHNKSNHKCDDCGTTLWTMVNPDFTGRPEWVKLSGYGFVYSSQAAEHLHAVKNAAFAEKIYQIIEHPEIVPIAVGAKNKYPLSTYIKKRYKGRIDGLVIDELHQYNNNSGQGDAMAELFGTAKKVVGMTGTLINGYSSGIFYLLYRIMPTQMLEDGKGYSDLTEFIAEYGVVENTYETDATDYNANRRSNKRKKHSKQLPGVSPLVYSRFLLEYAAFLSLSDMGKNLPEYEEIPVPLKMTEDVEAKYKSMQNALINFFKTDKKAAQKIMSAYLNLLIAYPDQPYNQPPIYHPKEGHPIVEPVDVGDFNTVRPKDEAVLDIVKQKIAAGERVLIYTNWTRLDTQKKLQTLLTKEGYYTDILAASVTTEKREEWIENCVNSGVQVLITNPAIVETGLDLIAFTTLIFYDTGYKLFTLRQASRRSWRINQTYPRIEVYMLYYTDTMQHKAIKLMASKLAVAEIIEGGYSEEGLAAMYQCDDMTSQMAKELMLGIKDNVEDVSSAFRRMSFLKRSETAAQPDTPVFTDEPVQIKPVAPDNLAAVEFTFTEPVQEKAPLSDMYKPKVSPPKKTEKKRSFEDENQISLFDLLENAA